jgi:ubiquinone/menaquinone biosynthesis C-methylase UbiE
MSVPENTEGVRDYFGSGADRYDARHYGSRYRTFIGDRQKLVASVLQGLGLPPAARVLDVACGPGHFLHAAVAAGLDAVGIDSSRDMLRTSKTRLGPDARLVTGDATVLPFDSASFDAVNTSGLIEYLPEPTPMLRELLRVLKPGGHAMVSSTNRISPALVLFPVTDVIKRSATLRRVIKAVRLPVDDVSLSPQHFRFNFHTPGHLRALLQGAGFANLEMHYCHLQLLPHPLDRIVPAATTACVNVTDRLLGVRPLRALAEGLLAVGQRLG